MLGTSITPAGGRSDQLNVQDFLRVLAAQLQNQDPLEPTKNEQFLAQTAQFTQLEQTQQLNARIDSLLRVQSATQSIGLLGKTVQVSLDAGVTSGQVISLSFDNGEPRLTIQTTAGATIPNIQLSQITQVR
jgi:flagellar basal-body rod modification protein FlgD